MVDVSFYIKNSISDLNDVINWFGQAPDSIQLHGGSRNWDDWFGSIDYAGRAMNGSMIDEMWSIPLIPYGANLGSAASGSYDANYKAMAEKLLEFSGDQDRIHIRLGWEFNGAGWFPHSAVGQPENYIEAFRNFVDAARSVSHKFVFEWCPNFGPVDMPADSAYPGDDYVDVIGLDFYYNIAWDNPDPAKAFDYFVRAPFGLQWQQDFAASHGKPTAIGEWGLNSDSPEFVKLVANWAEEHDMLYASYWESDSNFRGKLSDDQYPEAAQAFIEAFGSDAVPGSESGLPAPSSPADNVEVPDAYPGSNSVKTGSSAGELLSGSGGEFELRGGDGNDTYAVDSSGDVVVEWYNGGRGGIDLVRTLVDYTLPNNVENLVLTGNAALSGFGNNAANAMTGNSAANRLVAWAGNDILRGLAGNDVLDGGAGFDQLYGGDGDDVLHGGGSNDRLYGDAGADRLDGGTGADMLTGGNGDDTYVVDNFGDTVIEWFSGGRGGLDTVESWISVTLFDNVEDLVLLGSDALNGSGNSSANAITGNSGANVLDAKAGNDIVRGGGGNDILRGGDGNDSLFGDDGNDYLDGGPGDDSLVGGDGDDIYIVDSEGDAVTEWFHFGLGGTDTIRSSVDYTLGANLENLTLYGGDGLRATGNSAANIIKGNSGDNTIAGMAGNDVLYGMGGKDTFVFAEGSGYDVIKDFGWGDRIDLSAIPDHASVVVTAKGGNAVISVASCVIEIVSLDPSRLISDATGFHFG